MKKLNRKRHTVTLCVMIFDTGYRRWVSADRLTSPTRTLQKGGGSANLNTGLQAEARAI